MRYVQIAIVVVVLLAGATFVRYGSFSPCSWMVTDLAAHSGQSETLVSARVRAQFLLRGIIQPDWGDCLLAWWRLRRDGLPEAPA